MKAKLKYLITGIIVLIAVIVVALKYWDYIANPWTRDGQVRAQVIQITPRVSGPIVKLPIKDNQFVKAGDLLFEIDPRSATEWTFDLSSGRSSYTMEIGGKISTALRDVCRSESLATGASKTHHLYQIPNNWLPNSRIDYLVVMGLAYVGRFHRLAASLSQTLEG